MPGYPWSSAEKRIHSIVYPHFPDKLVAQALGKSIHAVRSRAFDHGLAKTARGKSRGYLYGWATVRRAK